MGLTLGEGEEELPALQLQNSARARAGRREARQGQPGQGWQPAEGRETLPGGWAASSKSLGHIE